METPFDGRTWTLRFKGNPESKDKNAPLREGVTFCIEIAGEDDVKVIFNDPTPSTFKSIWSEAENVYYDREFHSVRGDIGFDRRCGSPSNNFGAHFIISYAGRSRTGGSSRRLDIELFSNDLSISVPTRHLLPRRDPISLSLIDSSARSFFALPSPFDTGELSLADPSQQKPPGSVPNEAKGLWHADD